jgi:NADH-quinone oxidoreductase subunit E
MLRRLHPHQPASFAFTPANLAWAQGQITKYPEGRQASAIIPLLWRAQEQEGWLSRPAIEHVAGMLGLAYIRALEVATFYFMFQLQPVGSVAHVQICGTTSCMICGAEDLVAVCKELIAKTPHTLSADGKFSWEEVECLGACANAPMAQIGKDYYEDLTPDILRDLISSFSYGEVPVPGPQNGRFAAEPLGGLTSLAPYAKGRGRYNASAQAAVDLADTLRRIDGTEVPLTTPWLGKAAKAASSAKAAAKAAPEPKAKPAKSAKAKPVAEPASGTASRPAALKAARKGKADDLTLILGIGPKLATLCQSLGFYHFDQIAAWTPAEIAWVDDNLTGFKGRVTRDKWVVQAKVLAAGGSAADAEQATKA